MALHWDWTDKMGKITLKQRDGHNVSSNIYDGNCLAIFICEYKNEDGEDMYQLWDFFLDRKHVNRALKNNDGKLWSHKVVSIELNLYYDNAKTLLNILTKAGYKVKCYYKEIKK